MFVFDFPLGLKSFFRSFLIFFRRFAGGQVCVHIVPNTCQMLSESFSSSFFFSLNLRFRFFLSFSFWIVYLFHLIFFSKLYFSSSSSYFLFVARVKHRNSKFKLSIMHNDRMKIYRQSFILRWFLSSSFFLSCETRFYRILLQLVFSFVCDD